jgi:hypothetical protein
MTDVKPKRRWFRFSLRTLFVLVTVLCLWLAYQMSFVHQRKRLLSRLDSVVPGRYPTYETAIRNGEPCVLVGEVVTPSECQLSWIRKAFGDKLVPVIFLPKSISADEVKEFRTAFPESIVSQMPDEITASNTVRPAPGKHFEKLGDSYTVK